MDREDYFGDTDSEIRAKKSLALVIYDISDNKQRTRMVKLLESFGIRVQRSAFEAWLDKKSYTKLCTMITDLVEPDDHVKIYRLSGASETRVWGDMPDFDDEEIIII